MQEKPLDWGFFCFYITYLRQLDVLIEDFGNMDFAEVTYGELAMINKIVELSHTIDDSGYIHTSRDWDFVKILWKFWKMHQPSHYASFMREMRIYNESYKNNKYGVKEERGGAFVQHLGNIPDTFLRLLENYFPKQNFNKDFYKRLSAEISEFNLGNKI